MLIYLNWPKILFFVTFSVFGFFSLFSGKENLLTTIFSIGLLISYFLIDKKKIIGNSSVKVDKSFFYIYLILFFIIFLLSLNDINHSLYCDELATSIRSLRWPIYTSMFFLHHTDIDYLKLLPFRYIVQITGVIFVGLFSFITYRIFYKLNYKTLFFTLVVLILFRLFAQDTTVNLPLGHIPVLIFSSLFGISDITIRISYVFSSAILITCIYNLLINSLGRINSFLFSLFIITIPIVTKITNFVEYTIWSALITIFGILYFEINKTYSLKKILAIFVIGALFRFNIIFGSILLIKSFFTNKIKNIKINFIYTLIFFIIIFPILFNLFNNEHPAISEFSLNKVIENSIFGIQKMNFWQNIINDFPFYSGIFFIIAFFSKRNFFYYFFLFIILNVIYLNIDSNLIGHPKYSAEYLLPFIVLGVFRIKNFLEILPNKYKNYLYSLFLLILLLVNIDSFLFINNNKHSFEEIIKNEKENDFSKLKIHTIKPIYPINKIFEEINNNNIKRETLIVGCFYGNFVELVNNYNYYEIVHINKLNNDHLKKKKSIADLLLIDDYNINNIFIFDYKLEGEFLENEKFKLFKQLNHKINNNKIYFYKKVN